MCDRCLNERHADYKDYGGRGIAVCEPWLRFENFLADMGLRPSGMWLDRINNEGNYELGNCRWTTPAQSQQNRRSTKITAAQAREIRLLHRRGYTQAELAKEFHINQSTVSRIINQNYWR
jgi:DNA-binding CsgD family transcriptional regulator